MTISRTLGLAIILSLGFGLNASAQVKSKALTTFLKTGTTVKTTATVTPTVVAPKISLTPVVPPRPGGSNGCGPRPI